ncbi:J domain-containing protein [Mariniblastus fucicola]|uniref:DnaJ domain protein n=1 Tax=Mariniblastus fucicola TaxID=980251 RepID=A0A5B9PFD9_9BACT|nr:J domain-containing protein [Mariniblastus fucicola]QEG24984.1 DnaJ domain protein [Mariniblastus fucicola]
MSTDVDWSLLPYRAKEFFGLPKEFDRKTLKRAYNKLIRQYKPEKFPDEFKKIRAAFEMLEDELRYGKSSISPVSSFQEYVWQPPEESKASAASVQTAPRKAAIERLKSESPAAIYRDFKSQSNRSPYDFFVLATLSDIVTEDPTLYFKWLLTGLQEHPNDPGLVSLIQHFFHQDLDENFLRSALMTTSKVITSDRFYFVTEKGWQRLLRISEFAPFKSTLARCESNLKDHRNDNQIVFYAELLKAAIWRADPAWVQEKFALLEGNAGRLGPRLEYELEVLDHLSAYQATSSEFTRGCPTRTALHQAIVDYYSLDEQEGDAKVIECQNQLGTDAQALIQTFDDDEELAGSSFMLLWFAINEDVSQRHGFKTNAKFRSRKHKQDYMKRLYSLIEDLDETWHLSTRHVLTYYALVCGSYLLMIVTPFILLASWLSIGGVMAACVVLAVLGVIANKVWIFPRTIKPRFDRHIDKTIRKSYQEHWRGRFVQFFEATGSNMNQLVRVMAHMMTDDDNFRGATTWLPEMLHNDMGLLIYSMSVPYRR